MPETRGKTVPVVGRSYVLRKNGCICGMTEDGHRGAIYKTDSLIEVGCCTKVENGWVYLEVKSDVKTESFNLRIGLRVFEKEMMLQG